MRRSGIGGLIAAAGLAALASGCGPRIDNRGHDLDPDRIAKIAPGKLNRDDVREVLGSPSSIGILEKESWYYLSQRTETVAFFAPKVKERRILVVRFDDKGVVSDVRVLGAEDGRIVEINGRETPTSGNEYTIFEQLFGNLGRYKAPPAKPGR